MSYFIKIFLLVILATPSMAVIVKLSDLQTMAKRSDIVVHGRVGEQTVTKDKLSRLITLTQIEVIDSLYGAKTGEVVTVYQVGGEKDGVVMPLLGGQKYSPGQEIFLFGLKLDNTYVSYGSGQGKLDIVNENGVEVVKEDLGDVSIPTKSGAIKPVPDRFLGKNILKNEIRQMLKTR